MSTEPNSRDMSDWQRKLESDIQFEVHSADLELTDAQVLSFPVPNSLPKVSTYRFESPLLEEPAFVEANSKPWSAPDKRPRPKSNSGKKKSSNSRMAPPKDVVKLADRLFYVLQPPMELLLSNKTVELPFEPFDFQYRGVAFLFPRHNAVLADEMGLGKTMQAITTIRLLLRCGFLKNALLVCPKPLVTNWKRELNLWAPEVPVEIIEGGQAKRIWQWKNGKAPIKIANYELVVRDQETVTKLEEPFDLVVTDEAQRIKNQSNATSKTIRAIPRKRSWALTGTPIENSIEDLIGIFEFVSPKSLNSHMSVREIKNQISDHILRRTKEMVIKDMPPKLIRDTEIDLSEQQAANYEQAETDGVIRLGELGNEITVKHVFELVLRLKQICNFDPATGASSKLDLLEADLEEVAASGKKAIVFSQWVQSLDRISERLAKFNPLCYHGRIPSKKRDGVLAEFANSDKRPVILMSYGAGAVGLNLQFCRYVYLFDRWWNPAVEDQAINRAHRIGAAGSVTVTRMISVGTIEQRIHEILESKRALSEEILSDQTLPTNRGLNRDEIFGLFNLKTPQGTIANNAAA